MPAFDPTGLPPARRAELTRRACRAIQSGSHDHAHCLKRQPDTEVWKVECDGLPLIVKVWDLTPRRRLESLVRRSPAWRQARGVRILRRTAIPTSQVIDIIRTPQREFLVLDFIPGRSILEHLASGQLSCDQEKTVASAVGHLIARMLRARVGLRDPKPSNLICRAQPHDPAWPDLAVIDCAEAGSKNDPRWQARALVAECLGVGICPRRTILMRCLREIEPDRASRHNLWRRVAREVGESENLTPRSDPLAHSTEDALRRLAP